MTDPRFRALIDLVGDAIELPPEQRDPFLVGRCGADVALLSEARQLLALSSRGDITETARHAVMQAAGGFVRIESQPGQGTTVHLQFERAVQPVAPAPAS